MGDIYEQAIATYLTVDGKAFLAPQFNLLFNKELNEGGTCPDFVLLDFRRHEIVVVEVTSAENLDKFYQRVKDRKGNWFNPIRSHFEPFGLSSEQWQTIRFLGFVRYPKYNQAKQRFSEKEDVAFYPIEAAMFPWEYWADRMQGGIPNRDTVLRPPFLAPQI